MNRVVASSLLVASVMASLLYVRSRFLLVEMSYQIGELRDQRALLEQEKRELTLELSALQSPGRIEKIAKTRLGLERPKVPVREIVVSGVTP